MTLNQRTSLALFALALGLRVLYASFAATQPDLDPFFPTNDLKYALQISAGLEWVRTPVSPLAPGYPMLLAAMYLIAFKQLWVVVFLQAVISAMSVVALYWLALEALKPRVALLAALWYAVSINHMVFSSMLSREVLVVLCLLVLLWILSRPFHGMRWGIGAGLVYGVLIHVDPQFVLLGPVFLGFILVGKSRHAIMSVQYASLFVLAVVVMTVPWTIRNTVVYNQLIPISLEASRYMRPLGAFTSSGSETIAKLEERAEFAARTNRLETNAAEFWRVTRLKPGRTFLSDHVDSDIHREPAWSRRHNVISVLGYGVLLPFMIVGAVLVVRRRNRAGIIILITLVSYFLIRVYLGGNERSRFPIDPLIILLAFYGASAIWDAASARLRTRE